MGVPVGGNVVVNDQVLANRYVYGGRNAACNNDRILFAWEDNRRLKGMDVYAKLTDWDLQHIEAEPPVISYIDSLPDDDAAPYGPYPVKAAVTDNQALAWVRLVYQLNGGSPDTLGMLSGTADTFEVSIPVQAVAVNETLTINYRAIAQDSSLNKVGSIQYSFKAIGPMGVAGRPETSLPAVYALGNACPNPSRGRTVFSYQLPRASNVSLKVYNIAGQLIKTFNEGQKPAGYHQINWNNHNLLAGVYFYRLQAGDFSAIKKMIAVK